MEASRDNPLCTRSGSVPGGGFLVCAFLALATIAAPPAGSLDLSGTRQLEVGADLVSVPAGAGNAAERSQWLQARGDASVALWLSLLPAASRLPELDLGAVLGTGAGLLLPRAVQAPDPAILPGRVLARGSAGAWLALPRRPLQPVFRAEALLEAAVQPAGGSLLLWPGLRVETLVVIRGVSAGNPGSFAGNTSISANDAGPSARLGLSARILWEAPGVLRPGIGGVLRW